MDKVLLLVLIHWTNGVAIGGRRFNDQIKFRTNKIGLIIRHNMTSNPSMIFKINIFEL
jgi:hypothetical protein